MPELPDVEGFRRTAEHAMNRRIQEIEVHDAQVLHGLTTRGFDDLVRRRYLVEPCRRGKWLLLPTSGSADGSGNGFPCVLMHFGMTGRLLWCSREAESHSHDRVVFRFADGELRYRDMRKLKGIHLVRDQSEGDEVLDGVGPDALEVSNAQYKSRLTRTRRQLKTGLMDQSVIAGLGNLCVDETLWRARLSPHRATTDLTSGELGRLHRRMLSVLRQSIRVGRVPDRRSWLTGHRNEVDGQCPRCSARLCRRKVSGRTTVWCPRCQSD